jgi:hypothetical protein
LKVDDYELDSIDLEAWARRVYQDHASDLDDLDGYLVEDEDFPSDPVHLPDCCAFQLHNLYYIYPRTSLVMIRYARMNTPPPMTSPEARARQNIDATLTACGWDRAGMNLYAGRGVAVREFPLDTGYADYLLFVDRRAAGVIEAKAEGVPLAGVAEQAATYATGLPANIPHVSLPLPFLI